MDFPSIGSRAQRTCRAVCITTQCLYEDEWLKLSTVNESARGDGTAGRDCFSSEETRRQLASMRDREDTLWELVGRRPAKVRSTGRQGGAPVFAYAG
jgi:hypothetical protein